MTLPDFLPEFNDPPGWAAMYRACGLQLIPGYLPGETPSWKRPMLSQWKTLQEELVNDTVFGRWYGPNGEHVERWNMGVITGRCSDNLIIVDLDTHKNQAAATWWNGLMELDNAGLEIETCEQRTGGGGRQILFRAPAGRHCPTCKTSIGVDVRGQGGFAVLPPSRHESGNDYEWLPGSAPWEIPIADAPEWLLNAIDDLVEAHGGHQGATSERRVDDGPQPELDAWGKINEGREQVMRDHVWHAVLEWFRECPILPAEADWKERAWTSYLDYEDRVAVQKPRPGEDKRDGLHREGRGAIAYWQKWRLTMKKWGSAHFSEEAAKPNPKDEEPAWAPPPERPQVDPATGTAFSLVLTAQQFIDGFTPPSYLIDGVLQRGYLYSLTARTGGGKTAISMFVGQCVARGVNMHGRAVQSGTVLMLAGENPDDIRARFLVLAEAYGFDPGAIKMRFIAGVVSIPARFDEIKAEAATIDDLVLVIVDTAAAYFPGDETNSNSQQGAYARLLRQLTFLRGKPAVLVNCHPIKNAARDNLIPMGGSAFVNEVDGNLTLWANNEKQVCLHWLGKFRGPEFDPINFELKVASSPKVIDAKGRLMPSIVAEPISDATLEAGEAVQESDEDKVMKLLHASPGASFAILAQKAGWMMGDGRPHKMRVHRIMERIKADKFVEQYRSHKYRLTKKGEKEIGVGDDNE